MKLKCYCPTDNEYCRKIYNELAGHMCDAEHRFNKRNIVFLGLQGSQNYGLAYENSDVDTKLIVTPTFEDAALIKKPVSTTFIRKDNSHTDDKDIRLMFASFLKQNLNFIEILFTPYYIINSEYEDEWNFLVANQEDIAHYNPFKAVNSMKGVALNKFDALQKPFEGKLEVLAKFGYDPKQLHHLVRIEEFITNFIAGARYEECLSPANKEYLIELKRGILPCSAAIELAKKTIAHINEIEADFCSKTKDIGNLAVEKLLNDVQIAIMKKSLRNELMEE